MPRSIFIKPELKTGSDQFGLLNFNDLNCDDYINSPSLCLAMCVDPIRPSYNSDTEKIAVLNTILMNSSDRQLLSYLSNEIQICR